MVAWGTTVLRDQALDGLRVGAMSEGPRRHRRSIRLKGYDYSQPGAYFVTVCTFGHICLLGDVVQGEVVLNEAGRIVHDCWEDLPAHYPHVRLDAFVAMPNHVHAIVVLTDDRRVGAGFKPAPTRGVNREPCHSSFPISNWRSSSAL